MKLLAIDTSTESCSIALCNGSEVITRSMLSEKQHAQKILSLIDDVLSESDFSLAQLDCIAFTQGPGSFTGLRIGTGVVQGIAYAVDLPVILTSTLAVLAQGVYRQTGASHIFAAIDARMQQVYWGIYCIEQDALARPLSDDQVVNPDRILLPKMLDQQNQWVGAGSGWNAYPDQLGAVTKPFLKQSFPDFRPEAQDIIPFAKEKFQAKQFCKPEEALPVYLRDQVVQTAH